MYWIYWEVKTICNTFIIHVITVYMQSLLLYLPSNQELESDSAINMLKNISFCDKIPKYKFNIFWNNISFTMDLAISLRISQVTAPKIFFSEASIHISQYVFRLWSAICEIYTWNPLFYHAGGEMNLIVVLYHHCHFPCCLFMSMCDSYKPLEASVFICYLFIYYDRDM